ncbi:MAG: amino acid racemase [Myxococcota bacterium]
MTPANEGSTSLPANPPAGPTTAKTVGVLGGMGPKATLGFLARVLELTPAKREQDHLRMIVDQNPRVPDRNLAQAGHGPRPGPVLAEMARGLERHGADFVVMPCNTAHVYAPSIREALSIPFIDMIDATVNRVGALGVRRVGLLTTRACHETALYPKALQALELEPMALPDDEFSSLMDAIYQIKKGALDPARRTVHALSLWLVERGAEALLSGCTELPLVLRPDDCSVPLVDSSDTLARVTVSAALSLDGALSSSSGGTSPGADVG